MLLTTPVRLVVGAALLLAAGAAGARPIDPDEALKAPDRVVEACLPDSHPAAYLVYAGRLWYEARRDEAVFWLYVGQIRYRFQLAAHPHADPDPDLARFTHLMDTTGEPIERYAGGNLAKWRTAIARALAWDRDTPNGYTSKTRFAAAWQEARAVLTELSHYLGRHAVEYQRQRELDGIGEIGMRSPDGPYVEVVKPRMPSGWPALARRTTLPMLTGHYAASDSDFAPLFFANELESVAGANSFEIGPSHDERYLIVTARRDNVVLRQARVKARETADAVVLTRDEEAAAAGLAQGRRRLHFYLRRNEVGDLVIEREAVTDGTFPGRKFKVHLETTQWHLANRLAPSDEPPH